MGGAAGSHTDGRRVTPRWRDRSSVPVLRTPHRMGAAWVSKPSCALWAGGSGSDRCHRRPSRTPGTRWLCRSDPPRPVGRNPPAGGPPRDHVPRQRDVRCRECPHVGLGRARFDTPALWGRDLRRRTARVRAVIVEHRDPGRSGGDRRFPEVAQSRVATASHHHGTGLRGRRSRHRSGRRAG